MTTFGPMNVTLILVGFCTCLLLLAYTRSGSSNGVESFLAANRNIGMLVGAISVAAAWIWAPALFVSSQQAYDRGLAGVFWFALPNALALLLFSFLAGRVRKVLNEGYTLPQFIQHRLGSSNHRVYVIAIFIVQVYAVIVQMTGSLLLLHLFTGIHKSVLLVMLAALFLGLASLRGIRSAVVADLVKAGMITIVGVLVIPWTVAKSGGFSGMSGGFGGIRGEFSSILNSHVVWTFGIPISISLLAGITIDQQHWQRAFAMRRETVRQSFVLASILFALVPIGLAMLGFVAANPANSIEVTNSQLSGVAAVQAMLPTWGVLLFVLMVLAGLTAAGSSALCAVGSIGAIDIYKRNAQKESTEDQTILVSRIVMVIVVALGTGVAIIPNVQIVYLVLLVGAFRAALLIPTILALFWSKLSRTANLYGILSGITVGVSVFVYGSITENATLSSFGAVAPILISTTVCVAGSFLRPESFNYHQQSSTALAVEHGVTRERS